MASRSANRSLEIKLITGDSYLEQLARVKMAAFKNYDLHANMYPIQNEELMQRFYEERERFEISNPSQTLVAIVDTSRAELTIVAYARWHIPSTVVREQLATTNDSSTKGELDSVPMHLRTNRPPPPEGTNIPLYTSFIAKLAEMRRTYWDHERDYMLGSLATHPDERGRGCAGMLLKWGIQEAESHGSRIYLESTPMAHGVYQRYGWHDVDEIKFNLAEYGGEETLYIKTMVREPQPAVS